MKKTPNGMKREDKNTKHNYLDYFTPQVLDRYAIHMKKGAPKHGSANWKKGGYPKEEYLQSAMRHLLALWNEEVDEDHASSLMFNVIGYMHEEYLEGDIDD
jgi:hypothetical protein